MDKEKIEARMIELQQMLKQFEANGNAALGAMEECKYWLGQLKQEDQDNEKPEIGKKK